MDTERTDTGFVVGPAEVELLYSDDQHGVSIRIRTDHAEVVVHATPKGRKLKVYS